MKVLNRKKLNLMLSLLIVFAMTAFFFAQISKAEAFAIEDDATEPPAAEEIVAEEEIIEEPVVIQDELAEPEELLDEYIEVITEKYAKRNDAVSFEARNGIIPGKLRGSRLTGAEKKVYDFLKTQIEEVAAGNANYNKITRIVTFIIRVK